MLRTCILPFCLQSLFNICIEKLLESTKDSGFNNVDNSSDQHMSRLKANQHTEQGFRVYECGQLFQPRLGLILFLSTKWMI